MEQTLTVAAQGEMQQARCVAVIARRSGAREIERAEHLRGRTEAGPRPDRGRTEAARELAVMAETSGRVIPQPIPRGAAVEAGALPCAPDPGVGPTWSSGRRRSRCASGSGSAPTAG